MCIALRPFHLFLPLILLLSLATPSLAGTLQVPTQFATIQAAIEASVDGDTIEIAAGTYVENISTLGKAITLSGAGVGATIIDGSGATFGADLGSTVRIDSGEGPATILEFLTITGGTGSLQPSGQRWGAGILALETRPTLRHLEVIGNSVTIGRGAGAYLIIPGGDYTLSDCVFRQNVGGSGTGCYLTGVETALVENCEFAENTLGLAGGGIRLSAVHATIRDCVFRDTVPEMQFTVGAGLLVINDTGAPPVETVLVERCEFSRNVSGDQGGALTVLSDFTTVRDCTFTENQARDGSAILNDRSQISVERCVFFGNTSQVGGSILMTINAVVLNIDHSTFATETAPELVNTNFGFTMTNSIAWDVPPLAVPSVTVNVSNSIIEGGAPGVGNLDADPQFVDLAGGDLRLTAGSPAIDAGSESSPLDPDGSIADIGALPFFQAQFRRGDVNLDSMIDVADPLFIFGDFFFDGDPVACDAAADGNDDGLLNIADPVYLLNFLFQGGPPPPAPNECGLDPTPDLGCEAETTGC